MHTKVGYTCRFLALMYDLLLVSRNFDWLPSLLSICLLNRRILTRVTLKTGRSHANRGHFLTLVCHSAQSLKHTVSALRERSWPVTDLGYIDFCPGDVGQLWARLNEDLGKVVVEVAGGDHVKTHQDVEWQGENWQIPTAVNRCQGTGHNRAERQG